MPSYSDSNSASLLSATLSTRGYLHAEPAVLAGRIWGVVGSENTSARDWIIHGCLMVVKGEAPVHHARHRSLSQQIGAFRHDAVTTEACTVDLADFAHPDRAVLLDHWHIGEQQARRGQLEHLLALLRYIAPFESRVDLDLIARLLCKEIEAKLGRPRKPAGLAPSRHAVEREARIGNFRPIIKFLRSLHARDLEANDARDRELLPNYAFVASLLEGKSIRERGRPIQCKIALALRNIRLRDEVDHLARRRRASKSATVRNVASQQGMSEGSRKRAIYSVNQRRRRTT